MARDKETKRIRRVAPMTSNLRKTSIGIKEETAKRLESTRTFNPFCIFALNKI